MASPGARFGDLVGAPVNPLGKGRQVGDQGRVHALHLLGELRWQLHRLLLPRLLLQIAGEVAVPNRADALRLAAAHVLADTEGGHALSCLLQGLSGLDDLLLGIVGGSHTGRS
jgi:hypothetical protein